MKALNVEFNMWESHPSDPALVDYWQERLSLAGMTDGNARALRRGFVAARESHSTPTLNHVCLWIREQMAREACLKPLAPVAQSEDERAAQLERERAFLGGAEFGSMLERMKAKLQEARS